VAPATCASVITPDRWQVLSTLISSPRVYPASVKFKSLLVATLGAVALTCLAVPEAAFAKQGGHSHGGRGQAGAGRSGAHHSAGKTRTTQPRGKAALGVQRDLHGKIKRDRAVRASFQRSHPCPTTGKSSGACPGYVVDHVVPLKRGGADKPGNLQWQTKKAAKQKDRTE